MSCDTAIKHNKSTKKFEQTLKDKSQEEKCRLVYLWTKKMLEMWDQEIIEKFESVGPKNVTSEMKVERNVYSSCKDNLKPLIKMLKKSGKDLSK